MKLAFKGINSNYLKKLKDKLIKRDQGKREGKKWEK